MTKMSNRLFVGVRSFAMHVNFNMCTFSIIRKFSTSKVNIWGGFVALIFIIFSRIQKKKQSVCEREIERDASTISICFVYLFYVICVLEQV